jgi:hypothetical protein
MLTDQPGRAGLGTVACRVQASTQPAPVAWYTVFDSTTAEPHHRRELTAALSTHPPVGHADGVHASIANDWVLVTGHLLNQGLRPLLTSVHHQGQPKGDTCVPHMPSPIDKYQHLIFSETFACTCIIGASLKGSTCADVHQHQHTRSLLTPACVTQHLLAPSCHLALVLHKYQASSTLASTLKQGSSA